MRQLDLFSPDQETFRNGYRLIERLQITEAIEVFEGLGKRYDDVADVVDDAVGVCRWWMVAESEVKGLEGLKRAEPLWANVESGRRGTVWIHLRRGVAEGLLNDLELLGFEMAPAYGWIARVLPFPEVGWASPDSRALDILRLIEKAEDSRRRRSHEEVVACRKELIGKDPDVFSA